MSGRDRAPAEGAPDPAAAEEPGVAALPYRVRGDATRYRACLVDPRPGRAVHCPDLNACLVNEGRRVPVDCRAVHFGYAIPVNVVPLPGRPDLGELVFDPAPDISPEAVSYLLRHHPHYREHPSSASPSPPPQVNGMATTKHERLRNKQQPAQLGGGEPEEDIAAIAKQISDHAEAIYQTWKSRGLGPAEILTCHSSATAADKFGSALTPDPATRRPAAPAPAPAPPPPPPPDIPSINANNLEQLVNDFVVEDKARRAAARRQQHQQQLRPAGGGKQLPSSIQFALQKFEKAGRTATTAPPSSPAFQVLSGPAPSPPPPPVESPLLQETIETIFPADLRPAAPPPPPPPMTATAARTPTTSTPTSPGGGSFLDEVAREEERLINALKAGIVIAEERPSGHPVDGDPTSAASPAAKKSALLMKKTQQAKEKQAQQPRAGTRTLDRTDSPAQQVKPTPATPGAGRFRPAQQVQSLAEDVSRLEQQLRTKLEQPAAAEWARRQKAGPRATPAAATPAPAPAAAAPAPKKPADGVPHPELTSQQRLRAHHAHAAHHAGSNPVRPFLTRGSVAERVLIFEKCPPTDQLLLLDKRRPAPAHAHATSAASVAARAPGPDAVKPAIHQALKDGPRSAGTGSGSPALPPNTTLQRHVKASKGAGAPIPRFYFPRGKPQLPESQEATLRKITAAFHQFPGHQVPRDKFSVVTKACDCPLYWKVPLFIAAGGEKLGHVHLDTFLDYWKKLTATCHDEASRFVQVATRGARQDVLPEDLAALVQDVVDTHPGLTFLKEAVEFHSRYVHTVIARIYYCTNRSWSGRLSLAELRRSDLLRVIRLLEVEDDINQVTAFFSYEHFYVIYCKFWELDRDHDLFIDKNDLQRHNDHALSSRMIDRIFSGAVTRGRAARHDDKMSYAEFVWFLLSEEDKSHPTAIEYWFRCMDLDGDGYLSMYELEFFYEEQLQRLDAIGIETLPFQDCLCQMLDMIHPASKDKISLSDLKRCKMTPIFFDTFFNLEKYLEHEQRDPFASQRDHDDGLDMSDWDRFAADEYEALVAEEGGHDAGDDAGMYSDECDGEDAFSPNLDRVLAGEGVATSRGDWRSGHPTFKVTDFDLDEDYDEEGDYARDSDDCSV